MDVCITHELGRILITEDLSGFLLQFYKHRTTVQYKTISIRQFVLSNFVLSDRQIEDHKVIQA
jgi:hypothetical protein